MRIARLSGESGTPACERKYLNRYCPITVASTFSTPRELAVALARDADAGALMFGIDSFAGAGKSRLAKDIKACLGWPVVSVDCFLNKG